MTGRRALLTAGVAALVLAGLGGCVGVSRSHLGWARVTPDVRTKAEVVARFGEPLRKTQEGGQDVWYYRLSTAGPSGRHPVTEAPNTLFALVIPVWWMSRPEENARFAFDGDAIASAAELRVTERGFYCGLSVSTGRPFACGPTP